MNTSSAYELAIKLMGDHGLISSGWAFEWDRAKRRFGRCSYKRKVISLSKLLVEINEESEVKDTILHEIAHALTPYEGHNWKWKVKAQQIGARPKRCSMAPNKVAGIYSYLCTDCGVTGYYHRRPSRNMLLTGKHRNCRYKPNKGKLEWRANGILMTPQPTDISKGDQCKG